MEARLLRWLVLDLNSFFASCEQQEHPELRDRPLIVVQTMAETTCGIAASYPAKALGIKTVRRGLQSPATPLDGLHRIARSAPRGPLATARSFLFEVLMR